MADVGRTSDGLTFLPDGDFDRGSAAPSVPGSWRRNSFTRQTASPTNVVAETVYLYTDIQSPGTKAYWKRYGAEDQTVNDGNTLARVSGGREINNNDTPAPGDDIVTYAGNYDGASGTFTCAGDPASTCTARNTETGIDVAGSWTFKPGRLTNGVTVTEDEEYLYFGIWYSEPDIASGTHGFEYIAGGDDTGISPTNFGALEGTATYTGGAIGKYVTRNQVSDNAKIGTFTATATFKADFDDDNTLDGRITNFRDSEGPLTGWSVKLGGSDATQPAVLDEGGVDAGAGATTAASIGGVPATGNWAATLHGSNNVETGLPTPVDRDEYPAADVAGVTGWFDAFSHSTSETSGAAIAGAFAASP